MEKSVPTWLVLDGSSMKPLIYPGDKILVDWNIEQNDFKSGDLVLRRSLVDKAFVCHRLIIPRDCITKGDRSPFLDRNLSPVLGLITGIENKQKQIVWGKEGQRFKKLLSWLSWKSRRKPYPVIEKPRRLIYLMIIRFIILLEKFLVKTESSN